MFRHAAQLCLILIAACVSTPPNGGNPGRAPGAKKWTPPEPFQPPAIEDSIWVCDQHAGRGATLDEMLDGLARREVVFFGETHLDETTHRLELAVYEGLIERTGGKVVLAMEMFERDTQPALDDYLAGRIEEGEFLMKARAWSNYRTGYRPLIETAKRRGLPVVASNAPAALRRKVGFGGPEALEKLSKEERALLPEKLYPETDAYWERFERVVRGHMGMVVGDTPERRLTSAQSLWDNTMGESCVRALEKYPGHIVFHVNGAFHSHYRDGTVQQVLVRRPETKVGLLEAIPTSEFYSWNPFGAEDRADYIVYVKERARGVSSGFHAVTVTPELRYRLRLPHPVSYDEPVPLLVLLPDDGFRAADGLAIWTSILGEEAAIAVIEAPYPILGDDLVQGGRWFWAETFNEDLGLLNGAIPDVIAYLLNHYPIDPKRVAIAGEGTGATVVAATSLYVASLDAPAIAAAPRRYSKLRTLALPGPTERRKGARRRLAVIPLEEDAEWWKKEAQDWRKSKLPVKEIAAPRIGWARLGLVRDEVREALGLKAQPAPAGQAGMLLVLENDTPRARDWARRYALRLEGRVSVVPRAELESFLEANKEVEWEVRPLAFGPDAAFMASHLADGRCLPLAAGPFGGTTILIVPKDVPEEQRAAWKELQEKDAIKKRSRFARLVVLFEGDEGAGLADALKAVRDAGRRSVLVVPAVFCADAEAMRRWSAEAAEYRDVLDLAWLPGLGARLFLLAEG